MQSLKATIRAHQVHLNAFAEEEAMLNAEQVVHQLGQIGSIQNDVVQISFLAHDVNDTTCRHRSVLKHDLPFANRNDLLPAFDRSDCSVRVKADRDAVELG